MCGAGVYRKSVPSQFCCEPKTAPNNIKSIFLNFDVVVILDCPIM